MSEQARQLRARLAVHDLLSDVILVDWLSGLSSDLANEFVDDYTAHLPSQERERELRRLARIREKADGARRERLMLQVGLDAGLGDAGLGGGVPGNGALKPRVI